MRIKISLLIFVLFLIYNNNTRCLAIDGNLTGNIKSEVENEFLKLGLTWDDLAIDSNNNHKQSYSIKLIDTLFTDPIKSLDYVEYLIHNLQQIDSLNKEFWEQLFDQLNIENKDLLIFNNPAPINYVTTKLGKNLNQEADFIGSKVLRQYISALLLASESFEKDILYYDTKRLGYLLNNCSSIAYEQANPPDLNFYELDLLEQNRLFLAREFFDKAKIMKYSGIYSLGISLLYSFLEWNKLTATNIDLYRDNIQTKIIDTDLGKIAIGGKGDDTYNGNFFLIVDIGGNDTYVYPNETDKTENLNMPFKYIVDFSGNDTYIGGDFTFGGAILGVNILIDYSGNDSYSSGNFSLGSSLLGLGLLIDYDGDDIYSGASYCQGSSMLGYGILLDKKGNDIYKVNSHGQGFGFTQGFGILTDISGNDSYISTPRKKMSLESEFTQGAATGVEGVSAGGFGLLADVTGNDNFISSNYSQASSSNGACGILFNSGGDDQYQALDFSQGFSENHSISILADTEGNDIYKSSFKSQSYSSGNSFSGFFDLNGTDHYVNYDSSTYHANQFSVGIFLDNSGKDVFGTKKSKVPFNIDSYSGCPSIKLTIDNNEHLPCYLRNRITEESNKQYVKVDTYSINNPDSLLLQVIQDTNNYPEITKQSMKIILEKCDTILEYITNNILMFDSKRVNAVALFLKNLNKNNGKKAGEFLLYMLRKESPAEKILALSLIEKSGINSFADEVSELLSDTNHGVKLHAIYTLRAIGTAKNSPDLLFLLNDESKPVRNSAAVSIGVISPFKALAYMNENYNALNYKLKNSFFSGIYSSKNISVDKYLRFIATNNLDALKINMASFAGRFDLDKDEKKEFKKILKAQTNTVKAEIYPSLHKNQDNYDFVKELLKEEKDEALKSLITSKLKEN